ncbi:MAG TPA: pyridoxal-phosphate dependent enzyme, partial [Kofleriaceae bacterium]|nr:pyridoxal-phosphate dependent enzyme [Kofleriaceae bacterium]
MIYDSVVDTVGRTPLIRLNRIGRDLAAEMVVKMESRNPCASVKDRIAVAMLRAAREDGTLKDGAVIVEATSGNTGIGLAFACAAFGHKLIITMPETMSRERVSLLRMFGAEVVLTPGGLMRDAVSRAREIAATTANAVMIEQFKNPINVETHIHTTAEEILE